MYKATRYSSSTKNIEAVPGPSTEGVVKSANSRKGSSVSDKRVKNKIENKKIDSTKDTDKNMEEVTSSDNSKKVGMIPLNSHMIDIMVKRSITDLENSGGASFSDISKYMEENYKANMELLGTYVRNYLQNSVEQGLLEIVKRSDGEERYKRKKPESARKISARNLFLSEGVKPPAKNLEKAFMLESENLREKPTTSEVFIRKVHSRNQVADSTNMTENLEVVPGPSKKKVAKTSISDRSTASSVSQKRTRQNAQKLDNEDKKPNAVPKKTKVVSATESKNLECKAPQPKTSELITNAIKSLKKRNGATSEDIIKYMKENHVNMKVFKSHVNRFLNKSVEDGVLEKLGGGADVEGRYKIKKPEKVPQIGSPNLRQKVPKKKLERKKATTPKMSTKRKRI